MFSSKQYATMTMLKPSHVNVELVVKKIIACLNGIWRIYEKLLVNNKILKHDIITD